MPGEQGVKQAQRERLVCCSITSAASVSPKISPRTCGAAGRSTDDAAAPDLLSGNALPGARSTDSACQEAGAEEVPTDRLGRAGALRSTSGGLACLLSADDGTAPAAQCQAAEAREKSSSALWPSMRVPRLGAYEGMTIAASLAGAIAGGAAAGPLGVSLGMPLHFLVFFFLLKASSMPRISICCRCQGWRADDCGRRRRMR